MKIVSALVCLICLFSHPLVPQTNQHSSLGDHQFKINLNNGLNFAKLTSTGFNITGEAFGSIRSSFIGGAELEYSLSPRIAFMVGLQLVEGGGKSEETVGTGIAGEVLGKARVVQELRYFELPIHFKYYLIKSVWKLFVTQGVSIGLLNKARVTYDADFETNLKVIDDDNSEDFNTANFLLLFGGGFSFSVGERISVGVQGQYGSGLSNQYSVDINNLSLKSRDIRILSMVSIGV